MISFFCYICVSVLVDFVTENKWALFDVIYYEYGALVLKYGSCRQAVRAVKILSTAMFDDKQLLVLVLPHLEVSCSGKYFYVCVCVISIKVNSEETTLEVS